MNFQFTYEVQTRVSRTSTGFPATVIAFVMGEEGGLTPNDVLKKSCVEVQPGEHWYEVWYNHDDQRYHVCPVDRPDDTVGYETGLAFIITRATIVVDDPDAIKKGVYAFRMLTGTSKPVWLQKEY
ncbi:MAG: hypothetical protein V1685_02980 [Parcubacteria group bacterium]